MIRRNEFVVNFVEGAISEKKAVDRHRLQYLKQVARNTAADSYTAMKEFLGTVQDRNLLTNQKIERYEEETHIYQKSIC
jgi:hypothetical protein